MLEVTGTTVTTPCPRSVALRLAASLLTTTTGRTLFASAPAAGSRSTSQTSPRRIGDETLAADPVPGLRVFACLPFVPGLLVGVAEMPFAQQPHRFLQDGRSRRSPGRAGVPVHKGEIDGAQADADLHTHHATHRAIE